MRKYLLLFFLSFSCFAQSNMSGGLILSGNNHRVGLNTEGVANKTEIYYNPESIIEFNNNFAISIDFFSINPTNYGPYFAANSKNFELLLLNVNNASTDNISIELIINGNLIINIPYNKKDLYWGNWHHLYLKLDIIKNKVYLKLDKNNYEANCNLPKHFEFIFTSGATKGYECISAAIKDFKLYNYKNNVVHHWELKEYGGTATYDKIGHIKANVVNPIWLLKKHGDWEEVLKLNLEESKYAGFAFDENLQRIIFVSKSYIYYYYILKDKVEKVKLNSSAPPNSVYVFNNVTNKLYASYCGGESEVAVYDERKRTWSKTDISKDFEQHYYWAAWFNNTLNGDLLFLGGYGWYKFSNLLQKYDFITKKWVINNTKGDFFAPRNALTVGASEFNNKIYLFNGYGNKSGKQDLGTYTFNDLYLFNFADSSYKKLWGFQNKEQKYVFLSNLFFDTDVNKLFVLGLYANTTSPSFYAAKMKTKSFSLFEICRTKPEVTLFNTYFNPDTNFVPGNIFFSKNSKQLFLVMHNYDQSNFMVSLYKIQTPLISGYMKDEFESALIPFWKKYYLDKIGTWSFFIFISFFAAYTIRKRAKIRNKSTELEPDDQKKIIFTPLDTTISPEIVEVKYNIKVFGNLELIDKSGKNIASGLSSKLTQLFLIILLNSKRNGQGITSEKLSLILWPDSDAQQQKNSRNTSITRLRNYLKDIEGLEINFTNNFWIIDSKFCDFFEFRYLSKYLEKSQSLDLGLITRFMDIVSENVLLTDSDYEWLDSAKSLIHQKIVQISCKILDSGITENDSLLTLKLTDAILCRDLLNENALKIKLATLKKMERLSAAQIAYNTFAKNYKEILNKDFPVEFSLLF